MLFWMFAKCGARLKGDSKSDIISNAVAESMFCFLKPSNSKAEEGNYDARNSKVFFGHNQSEDFFKGCHLNGKDLKFIVFLTHISI